MVQVDYDEWFHDLLLEKKNAGALDRYEVKDMLEYVSSIKTKGIERYNELKKKSQYRTRKKVEKIDKLKRSIGDLRTELGNQKAQCKRLSIERDEIKESLIDTMKINTKLNSKTPEERTRIRYIKVDAEADKGLRSRIEKLEAELEEERKKSKSNFEYWLEAKGYCKKKDEQIAHLIDAEIQLRRNFNIAHDGSKRRLKKQADIIRQYHDERTGSGHWLKKYCYEYAFGDLPAWQPFTDIMKWIWRKIWRK